MRRSLDLGTIFLIAILSGCALPWSEPNLVIVERNKEEVPSWAVAQAHSISDTGDRLLYIESFEHVSDFTAGIKQAQATALSEGQKALKGYLKKEIISLVGRSDQKVVQAIVTSPELSGDFDARLSKSVDRFHRKHSTVADIYFEHFASEPPSDDQSVDGYYRVFVLVNFPKKHVLDLMRIFGEELAKSREPLKSMGRIVVQEASNISKNIAH